MATDTTKDLAQQLKKQIEQFKPSVAVSNIGEVLEIGDGIARVAGLKDVRSQELVEFDNGTIGIAFNLAEVEIGVIIMGDFTSIQEGSRVRALGRLASVPVGDALVGRVVDALGRPIDGKGPIDLKELYPIERIAPGVIERRNVYRPLQTGVKAIDAMTPV